MPGTPAFEDSTDFDVTEVSGIVTTKCDIAHIPELNPHAS
jgi:hypothetical protein